MPLVQTPSLGRRRLVLGMSATAASLLVPIRPQLAQAALIASPRQTLGPFYPRDWEGDIDNDLVVVTGEAARAMGQVVRIGGRVLDMVGAPLPGSGVEIWQCDFQGIYRHPSDEDVGRRRDSGFQGRGRTTTDAAGQYQFRTIRPVPYAGRTPHIHFKVEPAGRRELVTQMYVLGEERNAEDGVLNSIRDPRQRASVIVRLEPADRLETGALAATFDIVIG
jgi:protocatechuate 3,4-dioxygenase beta subunit